MNTPNENRTDNLKPIYYWLDGYWITDKEEADLMDEINAFGSTHGTAHFPADADPALIDTEIKALLAQQAGQAST
ncbi:MAG: hypothetical protein JG718_06395 [Candidatus Thiothrix moscowensis]|nr:hypothetical protein [Candidatus Thiothrix moscowensis]